MRHTQRFLAALVLVCTASTAMAADDWIALRTPLFGVVSQMSEKDTRRWASEFTQFVEALHQLYAIEQPRLVPLTIVLFDRSKAFAPYRPVTKSGQARNVDGLFGGRTGWSVIGMAGGRSSRPTRRVIQHEAVHWFMSAHPTEVPLWFGEGFAEVFSTFEVEDGKGTWGAAIPEHVAYLNYHGLQPLEEFLRVSQDEALHENETYYAQAWEFVHYFFFGNRGAQRDQLVRFLELLKKEPTDTAFAAAFGRTYADVDRELKRYLDGGSYGMTAIAVVDRSGEFSVAPASNTQVQFALARLALAGSNLSLAKQHADAVIANVPTQPEGYEMLAQAHFESGDVPSAERAVAKALEAGSRDAALHFLNAQIMLRTHYRNDTWPDEALAADHARAIADSLLRSMAQDARNPAAFEMFVTALLNVTELTATDEQVLDAARLRFPRSGLPLLARAAAANRRGELATARQLLAEARSEDYELPSGYRLASAALADRWLLEQVSTAVQEVRDTDDLDAVSATITAELAAADPSSLLARQLRALQGDLTGFRRHLEAVDALEVGDVNRARSLYQAIVDDTESSPAAKRQAERALDRLAD